MVLLTEHDVLHKKFQATKFRQEGYNQDEVDDFLDEVADTIRALNQENEALKKSGASVASDDVSGLHAELEGLRAANLDLTSKLEQAQQGSAAQISESGDAENSLRARIAELEAQLNEANNAVAEARNDAAEARNAHTQALASGVQNDPEAATGMLALAQRLHDEYVRNGKEESERIVAQATSEGQRIVQEAEQQYSRTMEALEEEKGKLEGTINGLREFESEYRGRLSEHLESLLTKVRENAQN